MQKKRDKATFAKNIVKFVVVVVVVVVTVVVNVSQVVMFILGTLSSFYTKIFNNLRMR
jgi:hypothetical protein